MPLLFRRALACLLALTALPALAQTTNTSGLQYFSLAPSQSVLLPTGTGCLQGNGAGTTPFYSTCPGGGSGSVTSIAITVPAWLTVSGSPITTSGTITIAAATGQTANFVLATPNGSSGALSPRALVLADLPTNLGTPSAIVLTNATGFPTLNQNTTGTAAGLAGTPTTGEYWGYNGTSQGWYTPSGSGTVSSCSAGQLAYYSATGTTVTCLTLGTNLSITTGTLNAAGGSGSPASPSYSLQANGGSGSFVGIPLPSLTGSYLVEYSSLSATPTLVLPTADQILTGTVLGQTWSIGAGSYVGPSGGGQVNANLINGLAPPINAPLASWSSSGQAGTVNTVGCPTVSNSYLYLATPIRTVTTTTDTISASDLCGLIDYNSASAVTASIPPANFDGQNFYIKVENFGAGTTTLTPLSVTAPTQNAATTSTTGGSLAASTTYYFKVVATGGPGTTTPSGEQSAETGSGSTNSIAVNWVDSTYATAYQIWYGTSSGGENAYFTAASSATTYSFTTATGGTSGTIPASNTTASTINGSTSLPIAQNRYCELWENNSTGNYHVLSCSAIIPAINLAGTGVGGVTGTLGAGNGGSGDSTLTAHSALIGEGTSPFNQIAPANDSVLLWQTSSADPVAGPLSSCSGASSALTYNTSTHAFGCNTISGGGTAQNIQIFTSSGIWTEPSGSPQVVDVICTGAGGGGGSGAVEPGSTEAGGGAGAGGGATVEARFPISAVAGTETVTLGTGGTGGTATSSTGNGVNGQNGGNTTFGSLLTAYGGGFGTKGESATQVDGGGGGGYVGAAAANVAGAMCGGTGGTTGQGGTPTCPGGGAGGSGVATTGASAVGASSFLGGAGGGGGGDFSGSAGNSGYAGGIALVSAQGGYGGGNGGAGGAGSSTGNGVTGTPGSQPGGGGGGGGGAENGVGSSGEGGAGAGGGCTVITSY